MISNNWDLLKFRQDYPAQALLILPFAKTFSDFIFEILGLKDEEKSSVGNDEMVEGLMQTILDIRKEAKLKKD